MAGYRPKSLDELNSMYDKTLAAEKAIRKGTDLLANDDFSLPTEKEIDAIKQKEQELKTALETADNAEVSPLPGKEEKAEEFHKPEITHVTEPVFIPVEKAEETVSEEPQEEVYTPEVTAESEQETPSQVPYSSFKADLMDDYMKIMSDEDDDEDESPVEKKKLSRKEKKKLKKHNDKAKLNKEPEAEAPAEQEYDISLAEETEDFTPVYEEETQPAAEETEETAEVQQEETVSDGYEDISSSSDDFTIEVDDDFNFPEDYKPEWMQDEKEETDEAKPKGAVLSSVLKTLLSLVIILAVAVASFATTFKCILSVNTGKAFTDTYYAFTAAKDYAFAGILAGDFVITEKVYAEDGDIFAYINYDSKSFEFAKRTKSITSEDEVIIVGENDTDRVLVSRDDSRGVVYATYTGIGRYIAMLTDYYIFIMVGAATLALGASLVIILSTRTKKEDNKKSKKEELPSEEIFEEENLFSDIG